MGIYDKLVSGHQEPKEPKPKKEARPRKKGELPEVNIANKQADNLASNIAILQFDEVDIEALREAAYKAQTYRLTDREIDWIKDAAYRLSKEVKRGKVTQVDILRVGIKLFERLLTINKAGVIKLLEQIK